MIYYQYVWIVIAYNNKMSSTLINNLQQHKQKYSAKSREHSTNQKLKSSSSSKMASKMSKTQLYHLYQHSQHNQHNQHSQNHNPYATKKNIINSDQYHAQRFGYKGGQISGQQSPLKNGTYRMDDNYSPYESTTKPYANTQTMQLHPTNTSMKKKPTSSYNGIFSTQRKNKNNTNNENNGNQAYYLYSDEYDRSRNQQRDLMQDLNVRDQRRDLENTNTNRHTFVDGQNFLRNGIGVRGNAGDMYMNGRDHINYVNMGINPNTHINNTNRDNKTKFFQPNGYLNNFYNNSQSQPRNPKPQPHTNMQQNQIIDKFIKTPQNNNNNEYDDICSDNYEQYTNINTRSEVNLQRNNYKLVTRNNSPYQKSAQNIKYSDFVNTTKQLKNSRNGGYDNGMESRMIRLDVGGVSREREMGGRVVGYLAAYGYGSQEQMQNVVHRKNNDANRNNKKQRLSLSKNLTPQPHPLTIQTSKTENNITSHPHPHPHPAHFRQNSIPTILPNKHADPPTRSHHPTANTIDNQTYESEDRSCEGRALMRVGTYELETVRIGGDWEDCGEGYGNVYGYNTSKKGYKRVNDNNTQPNNQAKTAPYFNSTQKSTQLQPPPQTSESPHFAKQPQKSVSITRGSPVRVNQSNNSSHANSNANANTNTNPNTNTNTNMNKKYKQLQSNLIKNVGNFDFFFCSYCMMYISGLQKKLHYPQCSQQLKLPTMTPHQKYKIALQKFPYLVRASEKIKKREAEIKHAYDMVVNCGKMPEGFVPYYAGGDIGAGDGSFWFEGRGGEGEGVGVDWVGSVNGRIYYSQSQIQLAENVFLTTLVFPHLASKNTPTFCQPLFSTNPKHTHA